MIEPPRRFLLDTHTAGALLRANAPDVLRNRVREAPLGVLWLSAITEGELRAGVTLRGATPQLTLALELLLRNVPTAPFDRSAAIAFASLAPHTRLAEGALSALDQLIAAHAISLDATLVTPETRFSPITGLRTEDWLAP
ncbi:MAG: PIN domain-containing protein [Pseudomonadota bacterium]